MPQTTTDSMMAMASIDLGDPIPPPDVQLDVVDVPTPIESPEERCEIFKFLQILLRLK